MLVMLVARLPVDHAKNDFCCLFMFKILRQTKNHCVLFPVFLYKDLCWRAGATGIPELRQLRPGMPASLGMIGCTIKAGLGPRHGRCQTPQR